jgi:electron transfer flavoprotein beta subunit
MKVIVCIKQIGLLLKPIYAAMDTVENDPGNLVYMLNPYDETAVEEATRLKESLGAEVTVITAGPPRSEEALRYCFALGADKMIRIDCDASDPWETAVVLAGAIRSNDYQMILCGKRAIDTNGEQVGSYVAELLGLPQVSSITGLVIMEQDKAIACKNLGKGDMLEIECDLPALFTMDRALNEPGYPRLARRLLAEEQEITVIKPDDASLNVNEVRKRQGSMQLRPPRPRVRKIFTPESTLSAGERLSLLMGGGASSKKDTKIVGGPATLVAEKLVDFLVKNGIVP